MVHITRRQFASSATLAPRSFADAGLSACSAESEDVGYEAAVAQTWRNSEAPGQDGPSAISPPARDPGRELVRLPVLAPSSHNTQCWKFKLENRAVLILPDLQRRCPAVEPDDHHLCMSLGCACEKLVQAATGRRESALGRGGPLLRTFCPSSHGVGDPKCVREPTRGRGVCAVI